MQRPILLDGHGAHQGEALGVGADLRGVERITHRIDQLLLVAGEVRLRSLEDFRGGDAFFFQRADAAGEDGFRNGRDGNAGVESVGHGPFARSFLSGAVLDDVDDGGAGHGVFHRKDVGRDFDEKGIEVAGVPIGEGFLRFLDGEPNPVAQDVVGLANELHVAVFDAVVDHLDEVARAVGSDVSRARHAARDRFAGCGAFEGFACLGVNLGRDRIPDWGEFFP
jgi:hypothetical protein